MPKSSPLRPPRDIIEFVTSERFLGDTTLSIPQVAVLKAIYGLEMDAGELAAFRIMKGDSTAVPRKGGYDEASLGFGRRSGKGEKISSNIATYEAVTFNPRFLAPGETAFGILIAQNEKQARILRDYIEAKLRILEEKGYPIFEEVAAQARAVTQESIRLANRVIIQCFPCKKVSVRGATALFVLPDEYGHWQLEENAYNADVEVFRAVRPTRATLKSRGCKVPMISTSTPFDEIGVMYDHYKNRHKTRMLVLHEVPSRYLNPSLSAAFLEEERVADPDSFEREYLAKWGSGTQAKLFTREMVDGCTEKGRTQIPPDGGRTYVAHIDAAFKQDFFPLGIGSLAGENVSVDFLKVWKPQPGRPLSMEEVVAEQIPYLVAYGIDRVTGDQFCDIPLREEYRRHGIGFIEQPVSESNKYIEYKNLVSVVTARRVTLPDSDDVARDLMGLRRKGKKIEAPKLRNRHDDVSAVIRRIVYHLLPMTTRPDFTSMNKEAVVERSASSPPQLDGWSSDIMGTTL